MQICVVSAVVCARLGVQTVLLEVEQHVGAGVEVLGGRIAGDNISVVIVPEGDGGQPVGKRVVVALLDVRGVHQIDGRRRARGELDAQGDLLIGACRNRERIGEESVGRDCAFRSVEEHQGLVGDAGICGRAVLIVIAEDIRPPFFARRIGGAERGQGVHPCRIVCILAVSGCILGVEKTGIDAFGDGVGHAARHEGLACVGHAREVCRNGERFADVRRGDAGCIEPGVDVHVARKADDLRVRCRGRVVEVLLVHVGEHFKACECRIAVVVGGLCCRGDVGGTVGELKGELLFALRLVGDEEEAVDPAVVDILVLVVDIGGGDGRRVECGDRGAVVAVHQRRRSARAADLARLCPEGEDHVSAGRELVALGGRRVGRAADGHEHDDRCIVRAAVKEELVRKVGVVDVLQVGVVRGCRLKSCDRGDRRVVVGVFAVILDERPVAVGIGRDRDAVRADQKIVRFSEACIEVELEGRDVRAQPGRVKELVVRFAVDGAALLRRRFLVRRVADGRADEVVKEGKAVDVLEAVGGGSLSQAEYDGEGGRRKGVGADVERILSPLALGVDVLDLHLVERGAAHRLIDADVRARIVLDRELVVLVVVRQIVRAHPEGDLRRRPRGEGDGGGGGVVLPRTEHAVRRAAVVDHQDARLILGSALVHGGRLDIGEILHVGIVDGIGVVVEQLCRLGVLVQIVDLVFEVLIELEPVVRGHALVVPVRDGVVYGGELPAGRREIVPLGKVDDARSRIGCGRAGRERPVGRGVDEDALFIQILNVALRVELEIAVADGLSIRLGDGLLLLFVVRRVVCGRARRKDAYREGGDKSQRAERDRTALPVFEIVSHKTSFPCAPVRGAPILLWCRRTAAKRFPAPPQYTTLF